MSILRGSESRVYRVLVLRPNSRLGNTLLLTPLVQEIQARFPNAEIDILTTCPAAPDIFREFSCVRTIHQLPRLGVRHPVKVVFTYLRARNIRYDLIIDPTLRSRSGRFALRIMRGDLKIGFQHSPKNRGTDLSVPVGSTSTHMGTLPVDLFRRTVLKQRGNDIESDVPKLSVRLSDAERQYGQRTLRDLIGKATNAPVLAVALAATGEKKMSQEWWRNMLAMFSQHHPTVPIVEILPATGEALLPDRPGFFSRNIREIAAVIDSADYFVSADGGLMHLGATTNTTTLGLFKITDPSIYSPYGGNNTAIHVDDLSPDNVAREIVRVFASQQVTPAHANATAIQAAEDSDAPGHWSKSISQVPPATGNNAANAN